MRRRPFLGVVLVFAVWLGALGVAGEIADAVSSPVTSCCP